MGPRDRVALTVQAFVWIGYVGGWVSIAEGVCHEMRAEHEQQACLGATRLLVLACAAWLLAMCAMNCNRFL